MSSGILLRLIAWGLIIRCDISDPGYSGLDPEYITFQDRGYWTPAAGAVTTYRYRGQQLATLKPPALGSRRQGRSVLTGGHFSG